MKCAETLGFIAAVLEGFSEPPGLRMSVRAVGGMVDREILRRRGGYGGGAPEIAPASVVYGTDGDSLHIFFENYLEAVRR